MRPLNTVSIIYQTNYKFQALMFAKFVHHLKDVTLRWSRFDVSSAYENCLKCHV